MKRDKNKEIIIEQLKKTPIVQVSCEKSNISRASYYRWRAQDPDFAKTADQALLEGALLMNDFSELQILSAIKQGNLTAAMHWLRFHHPTYSQKVEINGHLTTSDEELTPEQATVVKEALRLASFEKTRDEKKDTKTNER